MGVRREASRVGDSPAVVLLWPLRAHRHMGGRDRTDRTPDRSQRDEGGRIPDAGEINLGRVVQRRILGKKEREKLFTPCESTK